MNLLEHQAKGLLAARGFVIPSGAVADSPRDARMIAEHLGCPTVIKAQVRRSDRSAGGGIRFAEHAVDAEKAAAAMLGTEIHGATVLQVLVEERVRPLKELYIGVTYDPLRRRPVLLASRRGGTGVEKAEAVARRWFSPSRGCDPYIARELGHDLGLEGSTLVRFGEAGAQLAALFLAHDATLCEINPLMVTDDVVVAVDAHITVDDDALKRQPAIAALMADAGDENELTALERAAAEIDATDHRGVAGRVVEFEGTLALLIGGGGASLCIFDAVLQNGLEPANYSEIGGNPTPEKVARLTQLLLSAPRVTGLAVVMNVVNNTRADLIAEGVIAGVLAAERSPAATVLAFRVPGADEDRCRALLGEHGIPYLDASVSLDSVIDILVARLL